MSIQEDRAYKPLRAGGAAAGLEAQGIHLSTDTRIEDGVSLLDALDDLGFVQGPRSAARGLIIGGLGLTGVGSSQFCFFLAVQFNINGSWSCRCSVCAQQDGVGHRRLYGPHSAQWKTDHPSTRALRAPLTSPQVRRDEIHQ